MRDFSDFLGTIRDKVPSAIRKNTELYGKKKNMVRKNMCKKRVQKNEKKFKKGVDNF